MTFICCCWAQNIDKRDKTKNEKKREDQHTCACAILNSGQKLSWSKRQNALQRESRDLEGWSRQFCLFFTHGSVSLLAFANKIKNWTSLIIFHAYALQKYQQITIHFHTWFILYCKRLIRCWSGLFDFFCKQRRMEKQLGLQAWANSLEIWISLHRA